MQKLNKPDWQNSVLNVSATLAQYLGAPNSNATLPVLRDALAAREYKNVVFMCFDGMGCYPLAANLPADDFLRVNTVQNLTSTFPSTTTNATTSLFTNKLPLEHGWLGWSLHIDSAQRNIDVYMNVDSQSGEPVEAIYPMIDDSDGYMYHATRTDYRINTVFPRYVSCDTRFNTVIAEWRDIFSAVKQICARDGKQFVYAYCPEPDHFMHDNGVKCAATAALMREISDELRGLQDEIADALFIVTADHGQIDLTGFVDLYGDAELMSMLEYPPYLDSRSPCFKVKKGMKGKFARLFRERYSDDFVLYRTQDLIRRNYFGGRGEYGYMLGDFVASGTYTHKAMLPIRPEKIHKGHHTALTEEMLVPLILFVGKGGE